MKKYRVICNEGTTFLSRTWREGETEQELFNIFENFYDNGTVYKTIKLNKKIP